MSYIRALKRVKDNFIGRGFKNRFKTKESIQTMYQQHPLEVFQCYFNEESNECKIKECGTKECGINFRETAFDSHLMSFLPHIILFSGHSQSLIPHFSKV